MASKLKNMRLTSVDLVRNGANQEADICLFKSADPEVVPAQPTAEEENIFKRLINWFRENHADAHQDDADTVEKDFSTFDSLNAARESNEKLWQYTSALTESIRSIQMDTNLDKAQKMQMMAQSLGQFDAAMSDLFGALCSTNPTAGDAVMAKSDPEEEEDDFDDEDDFEEVEKFNPNHDSKGRFASGGGGGSAAGGNGIPAKYRERFNGPNTTRNIDSILDDAANDDELSEEEFGAILNHAMKLEQGLHPTMKSADIDEIEEV